MDNSSSTRIEITPEMIEAGSMLFTRKINDTERAALGLKGIEGSHMAGLTKPRQWARRIFVLCKRAKRSPK
jgi:hypothetical protein